MYGNSVINMTKHQYLIFSILLLYLSISGSAFSGAQYLPSTDYHIPTGKTLSVEDGLSHTTVFDMVKDQEGYIWLATQRGIDRFDGQEFINISQGDNDKNGLSNALVIDLEVDKATGDLWIATVGGLDVLRKQSGVFDHISIVHNKNKNSKKMRKVHFDKFNNLWVGGAHGLYKLTDHGQSIKQIQTPSDSLIITDIISNNQGQIIAGSISGLYVLDHNDNKTSENVLLKNSYINSLYVDDLNRIWVGTLGKGLYIITLTPNGEIASQVHLTTEQGLINNSVNDIQLMSDNTIWVATSNGVSVFTEPESLIFTNPSLNTTQTTKKQMLNILKLFSTDDDYSFYSILGQGFTLIDPNQGVFNKIVLENNATIASVTVDNNKTKWIATDIGVYTTQDNKKFSGPITHKVIPGSNELMNKVHYGLYSDIHKTIWFTTAIGLSKLSDDKKSLVFVDFENTPIYRIFENQEGLLWIGTFNQGLFLYDPINKKVINNWAIDSALNIHTDSYDNIWVSTTSGLVVINTQNNKMKTFTSDLSDPTSIAENIITHIEQRSENTYLVGTMNKGLSLMTFDHNSQKASFKRLFLNEPIASLSIKSISIDENRNYWISSGSGIVKINHELTNISYFSESDGTFRSGYYIAAKATDDKHIYFASPEGVTYFSPSNIPIQNTPPNLLFTHINILKKSHSDDISMKERNKEQLFSTKHELILTPNDLMITFGFAALEYGNPETIKYAYRLIGFDEQWQITDNLKRSLTFTNLNPGKYRLEIKSTNRYGHWSENITSKTIIVIPPWWKTHWARIIWLALFLGSIYFIYRWRTITIRARARLLNKLVKEKTKELEEKNKELEFLSTNDPLTNILNRRGFTYIAKKEFAKYQRDKERFAIPFAILLFDVDHFKQFNDNYGHDAGDMILVQIVKEVKKHLRQQDVFARWGGEEFIILLPNTKSKNALIVAEKIRQEIASSTNTWNETVQSPTISCGIAMINNTHSLSDCIKHADLALYKAKENGRNQSQLSTKIEKET